ncbi:hypothetical protein TCE0_017f04523 [Talaromyces pinophilus]|uniref:Methyltransferase n=1 Tax=Talaromyces pinophilus TaxID=128442 RepID=A0A6V8H3L4_TALPI|nr:hypothetical protein TCE0_017f04523 [Talaromyces pinophilus]
MNPDHSDSDTGSIFTVKTSTTAPTEWTSEEGNESDVIYGGESTYSLSSSVLNYQFEVRLDCPEHTTYKFDDVEYTTDDAFQPNDDQEQNKLMLMHLCYELVFDGRLHLSPITSHPQNVLDIGTGRGDWAIDFAEAYPSARVIGTDLSPIQPLWVPPNCTFEIDDAEDDWLYNQEFDLIHTRTICGAIRDWPRFHKQAFDHVKPGGWFEMQENDAWFQRDDGSCPEWTQLFLEKLDEASILSGRRLNVARDQKQYMIDAGFVNVHDEIFRLPLSPWHDDPRMKEIGRIRGVAMNEGVEGYSLALYTRFLGWSPTEVRILLAKVRSEFNDMQNQMYIAVHVVYGQKPEEPVAQ